MADESIFTAISEFSPLQLAPETDSFYDSSGRDITVNNVELIVADWSNEELWLTPLNAGDLNCPPCETEPEVISPQDDELVDTDNTITNTHSELLTAESSAQTQNDNMGAIISADRQLEAVDEAAAVGDLASLPDPTLYWLIVSPIDPTEVWEIHVGRKRFKCVPIEDSNMSGMETPISGPDTEISSSIYRESNESRNKQLILGSTNINREIIPNGGEEELNSDKGIDLSADSEENVSNFHETNTTDGAIPSTSTNVNIHSVDYISGGVKPGKRKSTQSVPKRERAKKIYSSNEYNQLTDADIDSYHDNLHELLEDARGEISSQTYNESKIITVYGKEAFRKMFSDDEIINCSLSGRIQEKSKMKMGKFSGVKKSVIARFLAFLISKREITWSNFKEYAISREKELCLSPGAYNTFKNAILVKYANEVRGQLDKE